MSDSSRIVLVTGGSGFLGRHCLPHLLEAFDEVHATTLRGATFHTAGVRWHTLNVLDEDAVYQQLAAIRPTHLLHLAWITEHGAYWNAPSNRDWLAASARLIETFRQHGGRRLVTAGTCAEYDWHAGHCHETQTACVPATLYGACKYALGRAAAASGVSAAHTRTFQLFGPYEDPRRLAPSLIRSLQAGQRAACSHGNQIRDFIYVKDAAAAHVKLLLSDIEGPVNIASGRPTTIREFAELIERLVGRTDAIDFGAVAPRRDEPATLTADTARLNHEVGFRCHFTTTDALQDMLGITAPAAGKAATPLRTTTQASTRVACPLCQSPQTSEFLHRPSVPVHQNLVIEDAASAKAMPLGTLAMHACDQCGFVFNAAFDAQRLSYGEQYNNDQARSDYFSRYLDALVQKIIDRCPPSKLQIVEVGCGKGEFLERLLTALPQAQGWGFDPAYRGPAELLGGRLSFRRTCYDASCQDVQADIIVCRHVIEHLAQPNALLQSLYAATADGAHLFFETPCVDWILDNVMVWDFFYEHCSLFSASCLARAFEAAGFQVENTSHVFGDQYLWLEAVKRPHEPRPQIAPTLTPHTNTTSLKAQNYARCERQLLDQWRTVVRDSARRGGVCVWGAGAKGVTFANLVDPTTETIDCLVDVNPAKQGAFVPGTGHVIVGPLQLTERNVATALVLNPNYVAEIAVTLASIAPQVRIVDLSQSPPQAIKAA